MTVVWAVFSLLLLKQNAVMTKTEHRSFCLWVSPSAGQIPRSGIAGPKGMSTDNCDDHSLEFVRVKTYHYPPCYVELTT